MSRRQHESTVMVSDPHAADDGDRQRADELLQRAVGAGRLPLAEYECRVGVVWAARTREELTAVTADLPLPRRAGTGSPRRPPSPALFALQFALASAAVAAGIAAVTGAGAAPETRDRTLPPVVVPAGQSVVDLGRQADELTVVVPDGVGVQSSGLDVVGELRCDDACTWPTGPFVELVGTALEDVHVLSRSEHDRGWDPTTIVE